MTEKQKEAIDILAKLLANNVIKHGGFLLLMDFVVSNEQQQPTWIPYMPFPNTPDVTYHQSTTIHK